MQGNESVKKGNERREEGIHGNQKLTEFCRNSSELCRRGRMIPRESLLSRRGKFAHDVYIFELGQACV